MVRFWLMDEALVWRGPGFDRPKCFVLPPPPSPENITYLLYNQRQVKLGVANRPLREK